MKKFVKRIILVLLAPVLIFSGVACGNEEKPLGLLKDNFADDYKVGFTINYSLLNLPENVALYNNFNTMTAENEMKWKYLRPHPLQTSYQKADAFIKKAKGLGIGMRGHALVWHHSDSRPTYLTSELSKDDLLGYIRGHISQTIEHFGDEVIYAWDVVNEAVTDMGNSPNGIYRGTNDTEGQPSFFYDIAGADYIYESFREAQRVVDENDYDIKLFYNDYNMNNAAKRARVIQLIRDIRAQGIRVDGVGMQAHYNIHTYKEAEFRQALQEFAAEDLEIHITELDLSVYQNDSSPNMTSLSEAFEQKQANVYASIFKVCREFKQNVTSITLWGVADNHTWLNDYPIPGRKNFPLLFDEAYKPKKAFYALMEL